MHIICIVFNNRDASDLRTWVGLRQWVDGFGEEKWKYTNVLAKTSLRPLPRYRRYCWDIFPVAPVKSVSLT